MQKIPTLFRRDPDDMRRVLAEVHPDCQWVLDGEGAATRKYDGTCVMFDGEHWWARREVKPGKLPPERWVGISHDEVTGKSVGWEPIEQSAFAKYHAEALGEDRHVFDPLGVRVHPAHVRPGTYELVGPKVNGNPERVDQHLLVRHGYLAGEDRQAVAGVTRDFDSLRGWLLAHPRWEGIVWHHPDGRMAKLKRRDFPA